jgi:uroporphyrin-III C-methyltransferase / precorrin-2 dehydrogenase / sirohydrochlorin ferrochelatase
MDLNHPTETTPKLYPLFLKLTGRDVLVAGAGVVAEGKIADLVAAGAHVRVVAPAAHPNVRELAASAQLSWEARPFAASDVDNAWLVVSATANPVAQRAIFEACEARRIFVIAIDDLPNGSAYSGSVIRRPPFLVAISSSGEAPALARLLREMFDAFLPADSWVLYAQELRAKWKAEQVPFGDRFADLVRAFKERAK